MSGIGAQLKRQGALAQFEKGARALAQRRYDKAERLFRQCTDADAGWGQAWVNLGAALYLGDRLPAARAALERAVALLPDLGPAHYNLAQVLLTRGDWERGFAEYEWRHRGEGNRGRDRTFGRPVWRDQDLTNRRLLILQEQGLGDMIQFARYLPDLAARGARLVVECPAALHALFADLCPAATLIEPAEPSGEVDFVIAMGDLPGRMGVRPDRVTASAGYLRADPARMAAWAGRLPPGGRRIGLVWQGNPAQENEPARSIPLSQLMPILAHADCRFVSLQRDHGRDQLAALPDDLRPLDLGPDLRDMADTAAVMAQLDLVISTCTAPAHLAGALGRPCWLLLKKVADWRWLEKGEATPWYDSLRLFRQRREGDWTPVVQALAKAL